MRLTLTLVYPRSPSQAPDATLHDYTTLILHSSISVGSAVRQAWVAKHLQSAGAEGAPTAMQVSCSAGWRDCSPAVHQLWGLGIGTGAGAMRGSKSVPTQEGRGAGAVPRAVCLSQAAATVPYLCGRVECVGRSVCDRAASCTPPGQHIWRPVPHGPAHLVSEGTGAADRHVELQS